MRDCVGPYYEIIEGSVTFSRIALAGLVIISAILCCLCYKWRNISQSFLYIECIIRMIAVLIPNLANYRDNNIAYLYIALLIMIAFYNDSIGHIIAATVMYAFQIFFAVHVVYLEPLTIVTVCLNILLILTYFLITIAFFSLVKYIRLLHCQLFFSNKEHIKLLNGMHEGLLIMSNKQEAG